MARSSNEDRAAFLLYQGARVMQRIFHAYLDEWNITYTQYLVLRQLWQRDGQTLTELADPLDLDSGTLSPLLRRMENAGLIERKVVDLDYRLKRLFLTQRSKDIQPQVAKMNAEMAEELQLGDQEVDALESLVNKLMAR
ncbi:Organic hydroperoxide resistance transcriptional regulator [Corynebacterium gerontici]|uniref:Organic hydroperoxide resistance transcriptional regulator n=2 Tax=Corynebacterium gerontici TaxID=2079234 RepID=A0A3G6IXL7_9CORY|nr:Organic hydroperoxide resistance transcriptional regulator [Corynebacterium gerontici]